QIVRIRAGAIRETLQLDPQARMLLELLGDATEHLFRLPNQLRGIGFEGDALEGDRTLLLTALGIDSDTGGSTLTLIDRVDDTVAIGVSRARELGLGLRCCRHRFGRGFRWLFSHEDGVATKGELQSESSVIVDEFVGT